MTQIKHNVLIDLTTTSACNCNCKYCFEVNHKDCSNLDVQKRQLDLIFDYCNKFNQEKFSGLSLSFWGGEPTINDEFLLSTIEKLQNFKFISYLIYTNGTLVDKWNKLVENKIFNSIKDRLEIQVSYDGEPHHTLMRGNNKDLVFKTIQLLYQNDFNFKLKATLSLENIKYIPQIWDSYYSLYLQYKDIIEYSPTLDVTSEDNSTNLELWKTIIHNEILKREYSFLKKYNKPLWNWFYSFNKGLCSIDYKIHLHDDGNIYLCHGFPYLKNKDNFIYSNIFKIHSLAEVIKINSDKVKENKLCSQCDSTYCAICHAINSEQFSNIDESIANWSLCKSLFSNKCKYYKIFGYESRLLKSVFDQYKIERDIF